MDDKKREYDAEWIRELDEEDRTDEQKAILLQADIAVEFESERQEAVNERRAAGIDDRLVTSYQLYLGERDASGQETLENASPEEKVIGSRVYVNITKQITNDGAAQIGDLLFPNDDRNYGLKPMRIAKPPLALEAEPAVDSKGEPLVDAEGNQLSNLQAHQRRVERSRKKCARMFAKLDASLITARYPSKARKVISHGAIYGTGIIKGPIPTKDKRGRWAKRKDKSWGLKQNSKRRPDVKVVSPFDWFPDMSSLEMENCRYFWERMALQPIDLEAGIAKHGYDAAKVRRILANGTAQNARDNSDATDEARAQQHAAGRAEGRYIVWERHGTVSREQLVALGAEVPAGDEQYLNAIITTCDGEVLKATVVPYESDEPIYSVYCWDEDPLSLFGFGIPWLMQDQQRSYVSAWRMALDNGGMSAVPQVLIDRDAVEPIDGKWEIRGGKEWDIKKNNFSHEQSKNPFQVVHIEQNLEQLFVMMDRSVADAYEVTGVTRVEKASQGMDNAPVTLGTTQIMQNNSSVSRRAQARRWDDNVTLGLITRYYDFFMQFEEDDDIKANMEVEPRGATVLLAKELTATNTMQLYQLTVNGTAEGAKGVELLRGIESVMQIPAGTYIETEEETEARVQQEQEAGDAVDPMYELEVRKVEIDEAKVELEQMDRQLNVMKFQHQQEVDSVRLQLEEATAVAHLDDKAQERIDNFHAEIEKLREKHSAEYEKVLADQQTKRDIAAAKIRSDGGIKSRENAVREREVAVKEREMTSRESGGEGI